MSKLYKLSSPDIRMITGALRDRAELEKTAGRHTIAAVHTWLADGLDHDDPTLVDNYDWLLLETLNTVLTNGKTAPEFETAVLHHLDRWKEQKCP